MAVISSLSPPVGDGQHQIHRLDHAQVAMAGLGRVHKHRRGAGGRQRGGDLAAHMAALAHAHHHHAAAHASIIAPPARSVAGTGLEPEHRGGFDVECLLGQAQGLARSSVIARFYGASARAC
jgi:hypothetical protein